MTDEERIALFLDYENLAIGAREALARSEFDFRPIADALAERGRVVVRRAYADWSRFDEDRRMVAPRPRPPCASTRIDFTWPLWLYMLVVALCGLWCGQSAAVVTSRVRPRPIMQKAPSH